MACIFHVLIRTWLAISLETSSRCLVLCINAIIFTGPLFSDIYTIVSQKQLKDTTDSGDSPSSNVQTIHVGPTDRFADRRKQCCNPWNFLMGLCTPNAWKKMPQELTGNQHRVLGIFCGLETWILSYAIGLWI